MQIRSITLLGCHSKQIVEHGTLQAFEYHIGYLHCKESDWKYMKVQALVNILPQTNDELTASAKYVLARQKKYHQ
jgi:hypothetical protein